MLGLTIDGGIPTRGRRAGLAPGFAFLFLRGTVDLLPRHPAFEGELVGEIAQLGEGHADTDLFKGLDGLFTVLVLLFFRVGAVPLLPIAARGKVVEGPFLVVGIVLL